MAIFSYPVRFEGTPEQRRANYESHDWSSYAGSGEAECSRCCALPYHRAASYPCGTPVPRIKVEN
jgi:hypothetical protein